MIQLKKNPVLALAALMVAVTSSAEIETARPNILFILADDCTHNDLGCYGGQAHTPNIDALAQQGMRFTRCFQAAPMCAPTRQNIYSGLYPVSSGAYPNHSKTDDHHQSIVQYLQPLGYRVALSGKRHFAPESVYPFELIPGMKNPDFKQIESFISDCKTQDQPFCLFICSNEPHTPWNKGDPARYKRKNISLPPTFVDTPKTRENMASYLAEITYFDGQVKQALDLLDHYDLADNTLVMMASEQGRAFPFAKWTCYDAGLQSALLVRWPGHIQPNSVCSSMVEYTDIAPTLIRAAGGVPPTQLEGRSFMHLFSAPNQPHKKFVFGIMTTRGIFSGSKYFGIRSVRSKHYKLIRNLTPDVEFRTVLVNSPMFKSWENKSKSDPDAAQKVTRYLRRNAEELYDLRNDPFELNNLAGNPEYNSIKQALNQELNRWMDACGDQGEQTELEAFQHQKKGAGSGRGVRKGVSVDI